MANWLSSLISPRADIGRRPPKRKYKGVAGKVAGLGELPVAGVPSIGARMAKKGEPAGPIIGALAGAPGVSVRRAEGGAAWSLEGKKAPAKKAPGLELPGGVTSPTIAATRPAPSPADTMGPAAMTAMDPRRVTDIMSGGVGMPGEPTTAVAGPAPLGEGMPGEYTPPALAEAGVSPTATKGVDWNRIAYILGSAAQATMGPHQESWQAQLGGFGAQLAQQDVYSTYVSDLLEGKTPSPEALSILTPELRTQALMAGEEAKTKRVKRMIEEKKLKSDIEKTEAETKGIIPAETKVALVREEMVTDITTATITAEGWIKRAEIAAEEREKDYPGVTTADKIRVGDYALRAATEAVKSRMEADIAGRVSDEQLEKLFTDIFNMSYDTFMDKVLGITKGAVAEPSRPAVTSTKAGDVPDWFGEVSVGEDFNMGGRTYKKTSDTEYEVVK